MAKLEGRVAIVTGAGRVGNIGQSVCEAFLEEGAAGVIASDIRESEAPALLERFGTDRFAFVRHDVVSQEDWEHVLAIALERFGGLDISVLSHAAPRRPWVSDLSRKEAISRCLANMPNWD